MRDGCSLRSRAGGSVTRGLLTRCTFGRCRHFLRKLHRIVDGYVVVVSARSTPRTLLGEALNLLDPASVIGLVFNRDDRPLFGYYRSHYGAYFRS